MHHLGYRVRDDVDREGFGEAGRRQALKDLLGVKVVEEENVPETIMVAKTMESMINIDDATLLFPTSFGYFNPFMIEAAKKYPNIEFRHPISLWLADKHPRRLFLLSRPGPL
jgi:basic membrane protein A